MSKLEEKRGNYRQSLIHCRNYALLLDTTESAIRKRKSRLKNDRLQADGFETLEEYIESIWRDTVIMEKVLRGKKSWKSPTPLPLNTCDKYSEQTAQGKTAFRRFATFLLLRVTSCRKSLLSCKIYHSGPYASINCHDSDTPPQEKGYQIHRTAVRTSGMNDGISLLRSVRAIPYRLRLTAPICPAKAPQTLADTQPVSTPNACFAILECRSAV